MDKIEGASEILRTLGSMRNRPQMWLGDLESASQIFSGMQMAFQIIFKDSPELTIRYDAGRARGWESGPQLGLPSIKDSELSERDKLLEWLNIEIDTWKRYLNAISAK